MKVILCADIKNVGKKDQVINASDGYARNFLFPKKLAVPADKENMNKLQAKQEAKQYKKNLELEDAKKIAEKINQITLKIKTKSGDNGKIFGSITSKEIVQNLEEQFKIVVDKKKVNLKEPIKSLGTTIVELKLFEGVNAKLKVMIVSE